MIWSVILMFAKLVVERSYFTEALVCISLTMYLQEDISHALVNCSWDLPVIRLVWLCFHQCVQFLHIFYILMNLQCVSYKIYFLILIKLTCLIYKSRESIVLWLHCNGFLTPLLALPPCFPLVIKWLFLSCYKDNFFPT